MRERWEQLTQREQWMLLTGGILLLMLLLIRFMWWPLITRIDRLHEDIDIESELIDWMGPRVARVASLGEQESAPKSVAQLEHSLQARHLQIYVTNITVGEQGQVSISLQAVPIPILMTWLNGQTGVGWQVIQATLTPAHAPGVGDVELVLG